MHKLHLMTVIHCHQPSGNFDRIFERAVERCYLPFLDVLQRHPQIKVAIQVSGCLFEWLESNRPAFLDQIGHLYQRGQLELLGGGFYEPMLTLLPRDDALGQLSMMREYLERRFGAKAEGVWLSERVWEPTVASLLVRSGARYTLLDDAHFTYAGVPTGRLSGYWITEQTGEPLALFPIDRTLRYNIPFRPVDEVMRDLKNLASEQTQGLVYGDDGEKFGFWPGTHEWVFEQGWLEGFFSSLEDNSDQIETVTPGSYLQHFSPMGRIYPPGASYEELQGWALPAEAMERFEDLKKRMDTAGLTDAAQPYLRGGNFANFLAKYPEANHLHKKMLQVSRKLREAMAEIDGPNESLEEARRFLYRGQCHCVYWHGLFGGVYLPFLREAAYRELINAENIIDRHSQGEEDWIAYDQRDIDCDLSEEILVENNQCNIYVDPQEGGCISEIDYRPAAFNLTNVFTRQREGYHRHLLQATQKESLPSLDAELLQKTQPVETKGLADLLSPDRVVRRTLLDRFPAIHTTLEDILRGSYQEEGDFLASPYHLENMGIDEQGDCHFEMRMIRLGRISKNGKEYPLLVEKQIQVPADAARVDVKYLLRNMGDDPIDLLFCPEMNFNLMTSDDKQRWLEVASGHLDLSLPQEISEAQDIALVDTRLGLRVRIDFQPATLVWCHPIETISQSEEGFVRMFQGSAILPRWEMTLPPQKSFEVSVFIQLGTLDQDAVVPVASLLKLS